MRWDPGHKSPDVIDRRGEGGGRGVGGFGSILGFLPLLLRLRYGWLIILVILGATWFTNRATTSSPTDGTTQGAARGTSSDTQQVEFVSFVLDDAQTTWARVFSAEGRTYRNAKLVLFTDATSTGCGYGQSASGPFYCPTDERVYIDLGFYDELAHRFAARGDFAQAYVIAHEIGHHVQKQLGLSDRVHNAKRSDQKGAESASVKLELQADCFAGIWAKASAQKNLLEAGDLDEALGAAAAIGDDRLQKQASGRVQPESWTHGSSEQRSRWLRRGYDQGTLASCDTFTASAL